MPAQHHTLELRFLVPPHLAEAARKAIAPYTLRENTAQPPKASCLKTAGPCHLTEKELAALLGG